MNIFKNRIQKLRQEMEVNRIDYYIIPTDDFHASEYVGDYFKCREFISGFTGSAGTLLVGMNDAGLWTDGRYFIQAEEQLKGSGIKLFKAGEPGVPSIAKYLEISMSENQTLGFDGRTLSIQMSSIFINKLSPKGVNFRSDIDLVDKIWENRPPISHEPIWLLDEFYSGMSRNKKLRLLRDHLRSNKADAILISALDEIAWLYNYRGSDILYTPVAMAYTIVTDDDAILYIANEAVSDEVLEAFSLDGVHIKPYMDVYNDLKHMKHMTFIVDRASTNMMLRKPLNRPIYIDSPIQMMKAVKNRLEIHNEKLAHIKDGIAMTKAIYKIKCLDEENEINHVSELDISDMIYDLRVDQDDFISLSFESIVSTGEHGAIIHYSPTDESDKNIVDGFLLIDSGAHYLQGTTDITRTISIGKLTEWQKTCYTSVLKGHLALSGAHFPKGTTGNALDVLARKPIWDLGLDFNHGTGHGVGYLLSVHEGPNAIRKPSPSSSGGTIMTAGMITSNEPGIYIEGEFGIRLENLILCKEKENGMLGFENMTLVPFDRDAIIPELLTEEERHLLNEYHETVFRIISPYLSCEEIEWLREETFAI